jgi:hypothetical protein
VRIIVNQLMTPDATCVSQPRESRCRLLTPNDIRREARHVEYFDDGCLIELLVPAYATTSGFKGLAARAELQSAHPGLTRLG